MNTTRKTGGYGQYGWRQEAGMDASPISGPSQERTLSPLTSARPMPSRVTRLARRLAVMGLAAVLSLSSLAFAQEYPPTDDEPDDSDVEFELVPSQGVQDCLPEASGLVTLENLGPLENMHVEVSGLPPDTEFDLFVIQVPDPPFGLSWYQGDMETDANGQSEGDFVGRFNQETFIVAPGSDVAPIVHDGDAATNPETPPVHTFHLGLWFNSPEDAVAAGCPDTVTPFNGEHNAGVQVLNTSNFEKEEGPLSQLQP